MLEEQRLWLGPWTREGTDDCRLISNDRAGARLGAARWRSRSGWFQRALRPRTLEVVEGDDESLLLTVRRAWGLRPGWEVFDADGRIVGAIQGAHALDPHAHPFALLSPAGEGAGKAFLASDGRVLGKLAHSTDGSWLSFDAASTENPFARMLLLAMALVD